MNRKGGSSIVQPNVWGSPGLVGNDGRMREEEVVRETNQKVFKVRPDEAFKREAVELLASSGKPPVDFENQLN